LRTVEPDEADRAVRFNKDVGVSHGGGSGDSAGQT
jgi:hypothetical protein